MHKFTEALGATMFVAALLEMAVILPSAALAAPATISGKMTKVTLYRGQAMVTCEVPLDGAPGAREIVIGDLPEHLDESDWDQSCRSPSGHRRKPTATACFSNSFHEHPHKWMGLTNVYIFGRRRVLYFRNSYQLTQIPFSGA